MERAKKRSTRSLFSTRGLFAVAALLPSLLHAANDGGTLSPFAYGVGARALSLGGAYVALGGGAASLAWNPAAAGAEGSKEFSLFYTAPFTDGNRFTYAGYIHPMLDLGTIGFGNLRYALGGISGYDDDGAPTGEFSNVQNEWLLTYALPPFGGARFGASLKVETHSLAGRSASSVGGDIGFLYLSPRRNRSAWSADNFGFGIALRNALEPKLTLESTEERFPTLIRTGFSYSIPLRGRPVTQVLLVASMEQGNTVASAGSFGVETLLPGGLALRFGGRGDGWTGGIGVPLRGGRIDYAVAMQEPGTAHRVEFILRFGPNLDALRLERARRDDERLAKRTEEELEKKERSQIDGHLAKGRSEMKRGNWEKAEIWFERALLWDPDGEAAQHALARARYEKHLAAGKERIGDGKLLDGIGEFRAAIAAGVDDGRAAEALDAATALLDRTSEKTRAVTDLMTGGIGALALGDFAGARASFEKALDADPGNADASRYLARIDSLLTVRVEAIVERAKGAERRGDFGAARKAYTEALELMPGRDDLLYELRRAKREEKSASAERNGPAGAGNTTETNRPAKILSSAEKEEAGRMYDLGLDMLKNRKSGEAIRYFEFVYNLDGGWENVASYLEQAYLFEGMNLYTEGHIKEAIGVWEKVLVIDPGAEKAMNYIRRGRLALSKAQELSGIGAR